MRLSSVQKFLFDNIDSIIPAIAGFVFILMLARYSGIGISPDSVAYTSVANSLATQGEFMQYDESPYVDFPIGYPVFLSIIFKFWGNNFVHAGAFVNAILFASVILACGLAMQRFTYTSRLYKTVILICIALSPALLEVYSMLWSETLFIFLSVLFIIAFHKYVQTANLSSLIIAAFITALMCVTRYAGICIIAAAGFILLFMQHKSVKQKIGHLLLFGVIACSLLAGNLIRNYLTDVYLTGEREKSLTSFTGNINFFGQVLYNWLPYAFNHHLPETIFGAMVIVLLAIAVLWHIITGKHKHSFEYIASVVALVYILFMIVSATLSRFEALDSRLFSPAFIPLLFVLAYWLNKLVVISKGWMKLLFIAINILMAVFFIWNEYTISYANYSDIKDYGIPGYTDDDWRLSPTVQYIKTHAGIFRADVEIYSNANDAVFFFTGHTAQQLPHKQFTKDINDFYTEDNFYVIWLNLGNDADLISLSDILKNRRMKLIKRFTDGAVYVTE